MTKKQREKRIKEIIDKWRYILFLQEWHFYHCYNDSPGEEYMENSSVTAEIFVNFPYKKAQIRTFRDFWQMSEDDQDSCIAHELSHCHTQQLWDFCTDFANGKYHTPDEVCRAVETLTQIISVIAKYGGKK